MARAYHLANEAPQAVEEGSSQGRLHRGFEILLGLVVSTAALVLLAGLVIESVDIATGGDDSEPLGVLLATVLLGGFAYMCAVLGWRSIWRYLACLRSGGRESPSWHRSLCSWLEC